MAEHEHRYGVATLLETFPELRVAPDLDDKHFHTGDALRLVGPIAFTSGGTQDRPLLSCNYEVKIIVLRPFPRSLPRAYSTDGQVPRDYHTYPSTGDLCLGAPLELRVILHQDPTLLGFVTGALVPFLYRHKYTVEHDGNGPPGWDDLAHGSRGLLQYYGDKLGVSDYSACLALLHQAGQRQQKKGRQVRCPCGSGSTLYECHYPRMLALRRLLGREALAEAYRHLRSFKAPSSDSKSDGASIEVPAKVASPN